MNSYIELRDRALDIEKLLVESYDTRDDYVERIRQLNNEVNKLNTDKDKDNPYIRKIKFQNEKKINSLQSSLDELNDKLERDLTDFLNEVRNTIQSAYEVFSDNNEYIELSSQKQYSFLDERFKRLGKIKQSIPNKKIQLSQIENDPGEIYKVFVYDTRDLTESYEAKRNAKKYFWNALNYINTHKEKFKEAIPTYMLAELLNIKDKDTAVALKNKLIESKALSETGVINLPMLGSLIYTYHFKDIKSDLER